MQFKFAGVHTVALTLAGCAVSFIPSTSAHAQNAEMMQKLQEIKASSAANKAALAHYTWQEQEVISLKGDVKKTVLYQVSTGPGGQQQKTELSSSPAPAPPSGGRLKQRIVEKKTDEYKEYGQQVAGLAKQYHPDPQLLQQAYQKGNISLQMGGAAGTTSLVIKNYLKPGDQMTLVFNSAKKAIQAMKVSSYLNDPSDAVTMVVQFATLPSGVNHVASTQVNGISKQMTVAITNSNYQMGQM
jgi:hypothetical protein